MTELEEVLEDFKYEFGLDQCTVCEKPTVMKDAIGFPWCADHEQHGKVMSWGRKHNYPELDLYMYKIASGEHSWWVAVRYSAQTKLSKGDEAFMWTALAYIEDLERQGIAS